jgi:hypothetical protein
MKTHRASARIQIRIRPPPVRPEEAIGTIIGHWEGTHVDVPQDPPEHLERRQNAAIDLDHRGKVVLDQPEASSRRVPGDDHKPLSGHPHQFHQERIEGCGKGAKGWFNLSGINVSYDWPYHIDLDHALNIDFVNEAKGPGARVAVELTPDSARKLAKAILAALEEAEADGWLSEAAEHSQEQEAVEHAHAH